MPNDSLDELQLELTAAGTDSNADGNGEGTEDSDDDELTPEKAAERERLFAGAQLPIDEARTITQRTAWILNRRPATRDSDVRLMLEYWERFHPDDYRGEEEISVDLLFRLPKLTSLARARAKIQNTYRLFQASPEVRSRRGTLSEEERERHASEHEILPAYHVFVDESGKAAGQSPYLIVGSAWILDDAEYGRLYSLINKLRTPRVPEFHFQKATRETLPVYLEMIRQVHAEGSTLGFRGLAVERRGLGQVEQRIEDLLYHLLINGVRDYNRGRAPLPRTLSLVKDLDTKATDRLLLANVKERLHTASAAQFDGQLRLDEFVPIASDGHPLIQLADMYTSSLNRVLRNREGGNHFKDELAAAFLDAFGWGGIPEAREQIADLSALAFL